MININNVTIKNFMSVGNVTQAVRFTDAGLTLVLGNNVDLGGDGSRNGTGKTTIINALSYALYGNALTNIRKDNLINKTNNKGMLVTVDFEVNGTEYRIERGRKPNIFKFMVNNNEMLEDGTDEGQGEHAHHGRPAHLRLAAGDHPADGRPVQLVHPAGPAGDRLAGWSRGDRRLAQAHLRKACSGIPGGTPRVGEASLPAGDRIAVRMDALRSRNRKRCRPFADAAVSADVRPRHRRTRARAFHHHSSLPGLHRNRGAVRRRNIERGERHGRHGWSCRGTLDDRRRRLHAPVLHRRFA
mgnify:CR=1 FL=1